MYDSNSRGLGGGGVSHRPSRIMVKLSHLSEILLSQTELAIKLEIN